MAKEAGAEVIRHKVNSGKGVALNTGFDLAVQRGADAAITLDADGQHDPDELPLFVEAFRAGKGDLIIGQRRFDQMPPRNQFGNHVGTFLLTRAMGQPVPDNQSGYRLHSRDIMRACRPTSARFEAEVEILLRAPKWLASRSPGCPSRPSTTTKSATSIPCAIAPASWRWSIASGKHDRRGHFE